ncbi:lipase family alpha/beta hydrolase [Gallaecimonas xiamenensis]|uniref:AB hydrolase-1 domain-containing protein n=1 Tax=Gallaecimonas xiamenensis 3-C-1 TaxID=745411 RepID=K2KBZ0_9GAMM|nr:alpha/beta fold hydrolase [Gallaecimonas xiamenensis]EKE74875.1 hypothetical protein B3C1_08306 [Gallaecimonas xiamenensis 3-C-1]
MRCYYLLLLLGLAACASSPPDPELQAEAEALGWLAPGAPLTEALAQGPAEHPGLFNRLLAASLPACLAGQDCQLKVQCQGPCLGYNLAPQGRQQSGCLGALGYRFRPRDASTEPFYPVEGVFEPVTWLPVGEGAERYFQAYLPLSQPLPQGACKDLGLGYEALLGAAYIDNFEMAGFFAADKEQHFGIFQIQPLDLDKDIVLMIHGLNSSPLIWRELTLGILHDPVLRERVQVWHLYYETGGPPFYNAARIRRQLETRLAPFHQAGRQPQLALVGHSMGGIIAKLLASDPKEALWDTAFTQSYPQVRQRLGSKVDEARQILAFSPVSGVDKVFFLDTPHRGAPVSRSWLARLAAFFVTLPKKLFSAFSFTEQEQDLVRPEMRPYLQQGRPSSVEVLRADHPLLGRLAALPLAKGIAGWSVIGNQVAGCEEARDGCAFDGVVTYQSAHQDGLPELVVPSDHNAYRAPQAVALILEVLRRDYR